MFTNYFTKIYKKKKIKLNKKYIFNRIFVLTNYILIKNSKLIVKIMKLNDKSHLRYISFTAQ